METFELEAFVVYGGEIAVIDGHTGEPFSRDHPTVSGLRHTFNEILHGYHRMLLVNEVEFMQRRLQQEEAFASFINPILEQFGIRSIALSTENEFVIEQAILRRLMTDPFFRIDALIIWDESLLRKHGNTKPNNDYARDIRYNKEIDTWERRIHTHWQVNYPMRDSMNHRFVNKRQGLNLDTNSGYHFIDQPLTNAVTSRAFREVRLTYPVFINTGDPLEEYEQYLKETILNNLTHLYDPFSWQLRRNMRFRGGRFQDIQRVVNNRRLRVQDRNWFEQVLARFFNDISVNQVSGTEEVYSFRMQQRIVANQNILGRDLDLLNWNKDENRIVDYDPREIRPFSLNFNSVNGACFILFDCYRRYPQQLLSALSREVNEASGKVTGQEILKKVFQEITGIPADEYIRIATQFQMDEFEKRLEIPWKH